MVAAQHQQARYAEWLAAQGLRFNFAAETAALSSRVAKGVTNSIPPVEGWHRILPTLALVEAVREQFGAVTLHSAYRSSPYNRAVGGVGDSRHSHNDAIDFSCATGTPTDWAAFLRERREASPGGIGVYGTFTHVDTRGTNADWTG